MVTTTTGIIMHIVRTHRWCRGGRELGPDNRDWWRRTHNTTVLLILHQLVQRSHMADDSRREICFTSPLHQCLSSGPNWRNRLYGKKGKASLGCCRYEMVKRPRSRLHTRLWIFKLLRVKVVRVNISYMFLVHSSVPARKSRVVWLFISAKLRTCRPDCEATWRPSEC